MSENKPEPKPPEPVKPTRSKGWELTYDKEATRKALREQRLKRGVKVGQKRLMVEGDVG